MSTAPCVSVDDRPLLRGSRVILRPLEQLDRPRLMSILAEPEVRRWWRRTEWERLVGPPGTQFVIEVPTDGDAAPASRPRLLRTIGAIQFNEERDPDYRSAGLDLFLSSELHGRGLGTEALRVLLRHLIDEKGLRRFIIDPVVENEVAVRCYSKVGFRPVGVMREYERVGPGRYRDALLMELLAAELVEEQDGGT